MRDGRATGSVAIEGRDYPGLRPDLRVAIGDEVAAGQQLFVDRARPDITFTSPASGRVADIAFGRRRTLQSVIVETGGNRSTTYERSRKPDRDGIRALLLRSGAWPAFRTRPFERIPDPQATPDAIFVTAMESAPLAADAALIIGTSSERFRAGLAAIRLLTDGPVFVCQAPGTALAEADEQVQVVEFAGPHPAGLPGTHINRLMPASLRRAVWHIGYQDVIAIGHLCETGEVRTERLVSVAGDGARAPGLVRTRLGANLDDLMSNELVAGEATLLSGSPISGLPTRYLGRYHTQVTALQHDRRSRSKYFDGRIGDLFGLDKPAAILPVATYERVLPFDILAVPLLRALAVGDAETAERLGCLELAEDDMALLTYFCPARIDYRPLLRGVLDEIAEAI